MKKGFARSKSLFLILIFAFSLCVPAGASVPVLRSSRYLSSYDGVVTRAGGGGILKFLSPSSEPALLINSV